MGDLASLPCVRVFASDFKRAAETAKIFADTVASVVREHLPADAQLPVWLSESVLCPVTETSLRERFFGDELEEGPNTRYGDVWVEDKKDATSTPYGAESASAVQSRTGGFIRRLERDLTIVDALGPVHVVLVPCCPQVSHGDALQLLQAAFQGIPASDHRSLKHLNPAELRELVPSELGLKSFYPLA